MMRFYVLLVMLLCSINCLSADFIAGAYESTQIEQSISTFDMHLSTDNHTNPVYLTFNETTTVPGFGGHRSYIPTILRRDKKNWQIVKFNTPAFKNHSWDKVYELRGAEKLWGFTENKMASLGHVIEVVFSGDGGKQWQHISTIKKPWYMAYFDSFRINTKGHGEVILHIDFGASPAPGETGYYHYQTKDWGKTWSAPTFTHDRLQSGEQLEHQTKLEKLMTNAQR